MENQQDDRNHWYVLTLLVWGGTILLDLTPRQPLLLTGGGCLVVGLLGGLKGVYSMASRGYKRGRAKAPEVRREAGLALLSVFSTTLKTTYEHVENAREAREQRNSAIQMCEEFIEVAEEIGMAVPELRSGAKREVATAVIDAGTVEKQTVYPAIAERIYSDEGQHQLEARLITVLTFEIDRADSTPMEAKFKEEIDRYLSGVSFHPVDERGEMILTLYQSFRVEDWMEREPGEVFDHSIEINEANVRAFMRQYTDRSVYQYLTSNEEQAREFRDTLADLIRLGRVDIGNLTRDVIQEKIEKVKQELEQADDRYSSYIVLSVKLMNWQDDHGVVEEFENNFPLTVRWKGRRIAGEGYPSPRFLSMRVTYADQTYDSAEDFLEQEIKPLLPPREEWEDGSFVAVMPFEAPRYVAYPDKETVIEESSGWHEGKIEKNFEAMELLTVGREAAAADLVAGEIRHEVDIEELLRVIPINVVAPDLSLDEKHFIQDCYGDLKDEFDEVETLFDWATVGEEALADALRELDDDDVTDDWGEVAEQLHDGVVGCAEASGISLFSRSSSESTPQPA